MSLTLTTKNGLNCIVPETEIEDETPNLSLGLERFDVDKNTKN